MIGLLNYYNRTSSENYTFSYMTRTTDMNTIIIKIFKMTLQRVYSRIARVCKNDVGGETILRDNWTTYIKARLNCSLPGEYPFYFDEIQGMTYLPDEGLVYATFTTPR